MKTPVYKPVALSLGDKKILSLVAQGHKEERVAAELKMDVGEARLRIYQVVNKLDLKPQYDFAAELRQLSKFAATYKPVDDLPELGKLVFGPSRLRVLEPSLHLQEVAYGIAGLTERRRFVLRESVPRSLEEAATALSLASASSLKAYLQNIALSVRLYRKLAECTLDQLRMAFPLYEEMLKRGAIDLALQASYRSPSWRPTPVPAPA